jgi:hypothetical protein
MSTPKPRARSGTRITPPPGQVSEPTNPAPTDPTPTRRENARRLTMPLRLSTRWRGGMKGL